MAGKRLATSELNHNNWAEEDEPEEAGSFTKATDDVIKNRIIKVAKRRNPIGTLAASEGEKKGVFSNFGGFVKPSTPSTSSSFGFLSNLTNKSDDQFKTNGLGDSSNVIKASAPVNNNQTKNETKSNDYYSKLKGLNQSVSKWIKNHVDKNPFLNLTPIFKDYEKYLVEIEKLKSLEKDDVKEFTQTVTKSKTITSTTKDNKTNSTSVLTSTNTTSTKILETAETSEQKSQLFNFGITPSTSFASTSTPSFNFGKVNSPAPTSSAGFSFGNSETPFAFTNVAKPQFENPAQGENEDEDEPPKVEFTPVVEEGHIYSVRCKVFVKKDDIYGDYGVGNLFLKPIPNKDKTQLIVRADTNLGNLLCNFILSDNIPMQRMGKKDVMLVCLPTPETKPPPVPILLRVKSSEEADELLQILEKHKK